MPKVGGRPWLNGAIRSTGAPTTITAPAGESEAQARFCRALADGVLSPLLAFTLTADATTLEVVDARFITGPQVFARLRVAAP